MKMILSRYFLLFLFITSLFFCSHAQGVHPQNLFDTGLNMGYLTGHHEKGKSPESAPVWAGNASAEWLSSWVPGDVVPVTPTLERPEQAHESMQTSMRGMAGCPQVYFNLRMSLYQMGYTMGRAVVETGYACSECLKQEMQKAAIEMRTVGQLLDSQAWQELSAEINTRAVGLDVTLSGTIAARQNAGYLGYLQSVLEQLNNLLPDELMRCHPEPETEPGDRTDDEPVVTTTKKEPKKRHIIITAGYTGAKLNGENGTDSQSGDGFYVGFDFLRGDPVFFMLGASFFRNSAGEEFLLPVTGQVADPGEYMQAFRIHAGLGAHVIKVDKVDLSVAGNLRLLTSTAIDGKFTSIGNAVIEDTPVHLNLGTYLSFGLFSVHTSYEFGLSPILVVNGEEMKYRMWNLGLGVRF